MVGWDFTELHLKIKDVGDVAKDGLLLILRLCYNLLACSVGPFRPRSVWVTFGHLPPRYIAFLREEKTYHGVGLQGSWMSEITRTTSLVRT